MSISALVTLLSAVFLVGIATGAFLQDMFISRPTLRIVNEAHKRDYKSLMDEATVVVNERDAARRELESARITLKNVGR